LSILFGAGLYAFDGIVIAKETIRAVGETDSMRFISICIVGANHSATHGGIVDVVVDGARSYA